MARLAKPFSTVALSLAALGAAAPVMAQTGQAYSYQDMTPAVREMVVRGAMHCEVQPEVMFNSFMATPMFTGTVARHKQTGGLAAVFYKDPKNPQAGNFVVTAEALSNPKLVGQLQEQVKTPGQACLTAYPALIANQTANQAIANQMGKDFLQANPEFLKARPAPILTPGG